MTSPYLNRPARSLPEVLRARGLTPADIGVTIEAHRENGSAIAKCETGLAGHPYGRALLLGICMISVIWIALSFTDRQNSGMTAVEMEAAAEHLEENFTPAAGQR